MIQMATYYKVLLIVLFIYFWASSVYSLQTKWDYSINGPDVWWKINAICSSGQEQSPINIANKLTKLDTNIDFRVTKHNEKISAVATNEGNMLSFQIILNNTYSNKFPYVSYIQYTGDSEHYYFKKFTFHWGTTNTAGSEHSIDDAFAAAEVQFFYEILDKENSKSKIDKLILAFLLKVGSQVSNQFSTLFSELNYTLPTENNRKDITIKLTDLMNFNNDDAMNNFEFYTFIGSLTTPPCSEPVRWIIAREELIISEEDLNLLRSLRTNSGATLTSNRRPLQIFNDREVKRNFMVGYFYKILFMNFLSSIYKF